ncbi:MAG TPA: TetR/AcrR family transcriptional regulator [Gammaproteobacteria bacterium]|nr:TetR/AcrR family transcriptional regulator [Gammaproteobacteria bacterium]
MKTPRPSLRERQARQVRESVLEAALSQLEGRAADDVSMAEVAHAAGVSLRTLYRYFPDRASLLHAAGEHVYDSLGVPFDVEGPHAISSSFLDAARRLSSRPALARALVQGAAGRATRSTVRARRVDAIETALKPLTERLDSDLARQARAVIAHLCSAASWVAVADESGLDDAEAQAAVAWAIDALVSTLQKPPRLRSRPRPLRRRDTQ